MSRPVLTTAVNEIGIDRADPLSIQLQIAQQIRDLVLQGRLKPYDKLPSTRGLALELQVARATVVEAYEQLASEGYIESRSGSGTRVAGELPESLLHAPSASPALPHKLPAAAAKGRAPARPFRFGLVDWEHYPHEAWGKLLGRSWRNPSLSLLEHYDAFGWLPLRAAIARHLHAWRGISCQPQQVIMTAGGMDAFDLVSRALFQAGDKIWMEDPGYPTAWRVFSRNGVQPISIPVDGDGLVVARARELAPDARAAFITPARHYPTGVTMPLTRRLEILDWANDAQSHVIEDDYDSEYRYVGQPLPALMSLDRNARVIYSGTFSKVLSPLLRLGYLVVPENLCEVFRQERRNFGAPPSLMAQPALANFMEDGSFAIHIRRMRRIYAVKRQALLQALRPGDGRRFTIDASPSGLMILLRLAENDSDEALVAALDKQGISVFSLSSHYHHQSVQQGLILSFSGFSETDLMQAASRLIQIIDTEPQTMP